MAKYALVIANNEYTDPGLAQLTAPGQDAEDFARVLRAGDIGAFDDVRVLLNEPQPVVSEAVDSFFQQKKADDLLMLYFSGHGVRDEQGALYLALKNTHLNRLRSTALRSDFVRESMDQSRSRRQVLILDCCNSGAFAQGTKAAVGVSIGTGAAFEGSGYGRVVLTATDSTQFAWEGERVIGSAETKNSLFTHFLVKGLQGEADTDRDGKITVDELYDYAYEQIVSRTPAQTPGKWSYKQQGEIILRNTPPPPDKPAVLPDDLLAAVKNSHPAIREIAVQQLADLLRGRNIALARAARAALESIAAEDDSLRVRNLAGQALEPILQVEREKAEKEKAAQEEAERLARQIELVEMQAAGQAARDKAEQERVERATRELAEKEKAARLAAQEEIAQRQAAREKAEREEAEQAALELAQRQAAEKATRELAEKTEREKVEREKVERAALELAQRQAAEKAARELAEKTERGQAEKAEQQRLELARRLAEKTEHEQAEKAAFERAEKAAHELAERTRREQAERAGHQQVLESERKKAAEIPLKKSPLPAWVKVGPVIVILVAACVICGLGTNWLYGAIFPPYLVTMLPPDSSITPAPTMNSDQMTAYAATIPPASTQPSTSSLATSPAPAQALATLTNTASPVPAFNGTPVNVTLWYSFNPGSADSLAFQKLLAQAAVDLPQYSIKAVIVPAVDIAYSYKAAVLAGSGPDLYLHYIGYPSDDAQAGLAADITEAAGPRLQGVTQAAIDGATFNGRLYGVPAFFESVVLWYRPSMISTPPATTDELYSLIQSGKPIGVGYDCYYNYGFFNAFGGSMIDTSGKFIADQGSGVADTYTFLNQLYKVSKQNNWPTDIASSMTAFKAGKLAALIDGDWQIDVYKKAFGDDLAAAPLPGGTGGASKPLMSLFGYSVNPKSANQAAAVDVAIYLTNINSQTTMMNESNHLPVRNDVMISDPLLNNLRTAHNSGVTHIPQLAQFQKYINNFCDLNKIFISGVSPADYVRNAVQAANK